MALAMEYTSGNAKIKIMDDFCSAPDQKERDARILKRVDAIVLAVVSKEQQGTYGYKITQDVRQALEVSESTLYPVLRRLQKDGCLEVYDMQFDGRNRRYYKVTKRGEEQLEMYRKEWKSYSEKICKIFEGGVDE